MNYHHDCLLSSLHSLRSVYVLAVSYLSTAVFPSPVYSSRCSPCSVSYPMPFQDPYFTALSIHCRNYLVKKTRSEGYCSVRVLGFIGLVIKEIKSTITIHQPPHNPSSFRDTCLVADVHCFYLLAIIRFRTG